MWRFLFLNSYELRTEDLYNVMWQLVKKSPAKPGIVLEVVCFGLCKA
jgi:hypothetical protein